MQFTAIQLVIGFSRHAEGIRAFWNELFATEYFQCITPWYYFRYISTNWIYSWEVFSFLAGQYLLPLAGYLSKNTSHRNQYRMFWILRHTPMQYRLKIYFMFVLVSTSEFSIRPSDSPLQLGTYLWFLSRVMHNWNPFKPKHFKRLWTTIKCQNCIGEEISCGLKTGNASYLRYRIFCLPVCYAKL